LGLSDFRRETLALTAHVKTLQKQFWQTSFGVSFPRIHATPEGYQALHPVTDDQLIRLIMAMRLFNPDITLTLSTREAPGLRDRLFGAGINQVSAGSKTAPGAYVVAVDSTDNTEQFPVVDNRTPTEVVDAIQARGLEWVFKDWDANLKPVEYGSQSE
jgi:2-iminoacetate synthase